MAFVAVGTAAADDVIRLAFVGRAVGASHGASVFAGVQAAADELSTAVGRRVEVLDWTPRAMDPKLQADALRRVFVEGLAGVIIDCVDPASLSPVIDFLAEQRVPVVTVIGDAAGSGRHAFSGPDKALIGRRMVDELVQAMGRRTGPVAVLGGDLSAESNIALLQGVMERLEEQRLPVYGVYPSAENGAALAVIRDTVRDDRDNTIRGWLSLGPWPLKSGSAMPWQQGAVQLVVADVIPVALAYVKDGQVAALVGEDYFASGYEALRLLLAAVSQAPVPRAAADTDGVWVITPRNVDAHLLKWTRWTQ